MYTSTIKSKHKQELPWNKFPSLEQSYMLYPILVHSSNNLDDRYG